MPGWTWFLTIATISNVNKKTYCLSLAVIHQQIFVIITLPPTTMIYLHLKRMPNSLSQPLCCAVSINEFTERQGTLLIADKTPMTNYSRTAARSIIVHSLENSSGGWPWHTCSKFTRHDNQPQQKLCTDNATLVGFPQNRVHAYFHLRNLPISITV